MKFQAFQQKLREETRHIKYIAAKTLHDIDCLRQCNYYVTLIKYFHSLHLWSLKNHRIDGSEYRFLSSADKTLFSNF
jgi:hypothetical protein